MGRSRFRKWEASLTLGFFLLSEICSPSFALAAAAPEISEVSASSGFYFSLPSDLGTIDLIQKGKGPALVHIQEAHGDPAVQEKIKKILDYLHEQYGFNLVLLEGSAGKLDRNLIDFFPEDKKMSTAVSRQLLEKSLLTGPELHLLENPQANIFGIEENASYRENVRTFREVLLAREKSGEFLKKLNDQIGRLTGPYLNKELRSFLRRLEDFEQERVPLEQWLDYLRNQALEKLNLDVASPANQIDWPMFLRFYTLKNFESKMNRSGFNGEMPRFFEAVKSIPQDLQSRVRQLLEDSRKLQNTVEPGAGRLFEQMVSALPEDFAYDRYPNVCLMIGHLILQSELDGVRLFEESEQLTEKMIQKMAGSPEEQAVVSVLKDYRLVERLFNLRLSRKDYLRLLENRRTFQPENLMARLFEINLEGKVRNREFGNLEPIENLFEKALRFYRGTEARDVSMLGKIKQRMQQVQTDKAVVITGGFHRDPFHDYAAQENLNYVLITPRMSAVPSREKYLDQVLNGFWEGGEKVKRAQLKFDYVPAEGLGGMLALDKNPGPALAGIAGVLDEVLRQAGWNPAQIRASGQRMPLFAPFGGFLNEDGRVRDFNRVDWTALSEKAHTELRAFQQQPYQYLLSQYFGADESIDQVIVVADNTGTLTQSFTIPLDEGMTDGLFNFLTASGQRHEGQSFTLIVNSGDATQGIINSHHALTTRLRSVAAGQPGTIHDYHLVTDGGSTRAAFDVDGEYAYFDQLPHWSVEERKARSLAIANAFFDELAERVSAGAQDLPSELDGITVGEIEGARQNTLEHIQTVKGATDAAWTTPDPAEDKNTIAYILPERFGQNIFIYDSGSKLAIESTRLAESNQFPFGFYQALESRVRNVFGGEQAPFLTFAGTQFLDLTSTTKIAAVKKTIDEQVLSKLDPSKKTLVVVIGDGANDIPALSDSFDNVPNAVVLPVFLSHQEGFAPDLPANALVSQAVKVEGAREIIQWLLQVQGKKAGEVPPLLLNHWVNLPDQMTAWESMGDEIWTPEQIAKGHILHGRTKDESPVGYGVTLLIPFWKDPAVMQMFEPVLADLRQTAAYRAGKVKIFDHPHHTIKNWVHSQSAPLAEATVQEAVRKVQPVIPGAVSWQMDVHGLDVNRNNGKIYFNIPALPDAYYQVLDGVAPEGPKYQDATVSFAVVQQELSREEKFELIEWLRRWRGFEAALPVHMLEVIHHANHEYRGNLETYHFQLKQQRSALRTVDELRAKLVRSAQSHLDRLSQGDTFGLSGPDLFLVLGNPDFKGMLEFVKAWKVYAAAGHKIPVVIAGGRGRGTVPLIDNVLAHYGDALPQPIRDWLEQGRSDDEFYENAVLQRIFTEVEGVDADSIRIEVQPSKRSIENFTFSAPVVRDWVTELGLTSPEIAIVTSPPLLRRIGWVAKKGWDGDVAPDEHSDGWKIRRFKAYDINLSEMDDQQLVDLVSYVTGYPDTYGKLYPDLGSWSEGYSELEGIEALNLEDDLSRLDWTELASVRASNKAFLDAQQVTYDDTTNRLILVKSELRSEMRTAEAVPAKILEQTLRELGQNKGFVRLLNASNEHWPNTVEAQRDLSADLLRVNELGQLSLNGLSEEAYGEHLRKLRAEMIDQFERLHLGDDETFVERADVINRNLNPIKREVGRDMETGFLAMDETGGVYAAGVTSAEYEDFILTRRGELTESFSETFNRYHRQSAERLETLHNRAQGFEMIRIDPNHRDSGEFALNQKVVIRAGPFQMIFEPEGENVYYMIRDVRDGTVSQEKRFTLDKPIMIGSMIIDIDITLTHPDIDPVMLFVQIDRMPYDYFQMQVRHAGSHGWMHTEILHQMDEIPVSSEPDLPVVVSPGFGSEGSTTSRLAGSLQRVEYRSFPVASWAAPVMTKNLTAGVALLHWGRLQVDRIVQAVMEARRLGVLNAGLKLAPALSDLMDTLSSFKPTDKNETPRHLIDHRVWSISLQQGFEDLLPVLLYLARNPGVDYTLLFETDQPLSAVKEILNRKLARYERRLGILIEPLLKLENLDIRTVTDQSQAALEIYGISAQAKQDGRVTALVSNANGILERLNQSDKRRYRLLKIKVDDPTVQSEISVAAAELLDEFDEDMLNQSDQALMNRIVQTLDQVILDMRNLAEFLHSA
ncbi:MAG: hypothetical protein H6757_00810 [Candidatus Omnitrophica bacterium]|nr:hypothetical protein [Candidatus Omnitrophota bacterium]